MPTSHSLPPSAGLGICRDDPDELYSTLKAPAEADTLQALENTRHPGHVQQTMQSFTKCPEAVTAESSALPDADVLQALGDGQLLGWVQGLHHLQQIRALSL